MFLVFGEAILLGVVAGSISSIGTYYFVNRELGGIPFPIAFFSSFPVLDGALWWWGAAIGFAASLNTWKLVQSLCLDFDYFSAGDIVVQTFSVGPKNKNRINYPNK